MNSSCCIKMPAPPIFSVYQVKYFKQNQDIIVPDPTPADDLQLLSPGPLLRAGERPTCWCANNRALSISYTLSVNPVIVKQRNYIHTCVCVCVFILCVISSGSPTLPQAVLIFS